MTQRAGWRLVPQHIGLSEKKRLSWNLKVYRNFHHSNGRFGRPFQIPYTPCSNKMYIKPHLGGWPPICGSCDGRLLSLMRISSGWRGLSKPWKWSVPPVHIRRIRAWTCTNVYPSSLLIDPFRNLSKNNKPNFQQRETRRDTREDKTLAKADTPSNKGKQEGVQ